MATYVTDSNYNVDLMVDVRALIAMRPRQHNQAYFSSQEGSNPITDCGTTCCIAGWTAAALGYTIEQITETGWPIDAWAGEKLGLNVFEASGLFYDFDNRRALRKLDAFIEKGKNQV